MSRNPFADFNGIRHFLPALEIFNFSAMNLLVKTAPFSFFCLCAFLPLTHLAAEENPAISLFDGESLKGWQFGQDEQGVWKVENGVLVGESSQEGRSIHPYLFSEKEYDHFEFRCQFRLTRDPGSEALDSGIQFRSESLDGRPKGYQADLGGSAGWGGIVEEQGRGQLAEANPNQKAGLLKEDDWNEYVIRANGPRVQVFLNGLETANFLETEPAIPYRGYLALELPRGGKGRIEFKRMTLRILDGGLDPKDTKAWWADKARVAYEQLNVSNTPQNPEEQLRSFELPDGFVAELVAQESEGIGKFVAIDFDHKGRMWTMTALNYPVDANREKAKAENLFQEGGTDKLLVFDTPTASGLQTPRVFADGLAIPLGVLPYKDGAIAQYGTEIRYYRDTDGDGKADKHEVLLEGFGIQDSHLFPHQFTRGPGGWMYLNQGLGNYSQVRRPNGDAFANGKESVRMDRCRIARMQLDGSDFQVTTTGPNNVWGIVAGRDGEWFIQEANDKGYPVAKYDFGVYLDTGGTSKLQPYQPILPPIFDKAIMGGTGLSGLVLAEDFASPFARKGLKTFYLANPLTSRIQVVTAEPLGNNRFKWQKEEDFLIAGDKWFRPVGIKFGPDGALYIVDWYNKIISHGEVPQNHPERDKVRGRIWRIRHRDQSHAAAPNLAQAASGKLFDYLRSGNALIQRQSWMEMIDRQATELVPQLKGLTVDANERLDVRLAALWALEGLQGIDSELLFALAFDREPNLRAEVVRIAGRKGDAPTFSEIAKAAAVDSAVRVRSALGEALVSREEVDPEAMYSAALLGKEALVNGDRLSVYEREFERFLARWAMEKNAKITTAMLGDAEDLPTENRLLAMQSLQPAQAARAFLPLAAKLERDLTATELSLLTSELHQPEVLAGFEAILSNPVRQKGLLSAFSRVEPQPGNHTLTELLGKASRQLIARENSLSNQRVVMKMAQRHRLELLREDVGGWLLASDDAQMIIAGLRCLRELGPVDSEVALKLVESENNAVQQEAVVALSTALGAETITELAERWELLSATGKQAAIDGLINSSEKAEAFASSVLAGGFEGIDSGSIEKLIIALGEHPNAKKLLKKLGDKVPMVVRLSGGAVDTNFTLKGPFTIEGWIRCAGKPGPHEKVFSSQNGEVSFKNGKLTLSGKGKKDANLVVAKIANTPEQWTHFAITRDEKGIHRIFLDGVLNATGKKPYRAELTDLELGLRKDSNALVELMEFRVWNKALDEKVIHDGMKVSYAEGRLPDGLTKRISGDLPGLSLSGRAQVAPSSSAPALMTRAEAARVAETFQKYQSMVQAGGDVESGKVMFQQACSACHMVNRVGGNIGPDLSGAGAMGDTSLLRNILTPNASLEASYYRHDLKLRDGSFISGFLAEEDDEKVTIRLIGADDRVIARSEIQSHAVSKRSLMPEGLLLGMEDQQVADLFEYLRTLK
ncbi:family 16 glycoside hydrolase [Roseibacillus persicicus]|uniref:DUF7133 domain-containing protein n=1 Tax=Roseibacillus persicicus TaxID=454148 RepID=UPI00398A6DCB